MDRPRSPLWPLPRAVRAGVFAAVCVFLTLSAHLSMSDVSLPASAVLAGFGGVYLPTWVLAGASQGPVGSAVWSLTVQFALHVWFEDAAAPTRSLHTLMDDPAAGHAEASNGMVAAHLLAGVVFTLLLRHGESAIVLLARLLRGLARAVFVLLRPPPAQPRPGLLTRPRRRDQAPRRTPLLAQPLVQRGPPAVLR